MLEIFDHPKPVIASIKTAAEAAAPVKSGLLRSNIKIRTMSKPSKGIVRSTVGVGAKDWTGKAFYASFVLWGHKQGSRKLGSKRKDIPGKDFLKASAGEAGEAAAAAMIAEIQKGIEESSSGSS